MTLSSTLEAKIRGREPSDLPAKAAGRVLGVEPRGEDGKSRFGSLVHWGYGTAWGTIRGLLGYAGLRPPSATGAHLGAVWGAALVLLPLLKLAPPAWDWGRIEVAVDLVHHGVYATTTTLAYEALS